MYVSKHCGLHITNAFLQLKILLSRKHRKEEGSILICTLVFKWSKRSLIYCSRGNWCDGNAVKKKKKKTLSVISIFIFTLGSNDISRYQETLFSNYDKKVKKNYMRIWFNFTPMFLLPALPLNDNTIRITDCSYSTSVPVVGLEYRSFHSGLFKDANIFIKSLIYYFILGKMRKKLYAWSYFL